MSAVLGPTKDDIMITNLQHVEIEGIFSRVKDVTVVMDLVIKLQVVDGFQILLICL